ncbi:39960_t:CDS:1, partial [Gigaspora margarita]
VEILGTLFGHYLSSLFNLEITFPLPIQITEIIQYDLISPSNNKKRTKRYVLKEWERKLQSMFNNRNETISVFQNYLSEFWEKSCALLKLRKI